MRNQSFDGYSIGIDLQLFYRAKGTSVSLFLSKDFSGCPTQKSSKTTRRLNCYASLSRPASLVSTRQGVETLLSQ
jgi:hypothetical protein